jgi:hypothetical protein
LNIAFVSFIQTDLSEALLGPNVGRSVYIADLPHHFSE